MNAESEDRFLPAPAHGEGCRMDGRIQDKVSLLHGTVNHYLQQKCQEILTVYVERKNGRRGIPRRPFSPTIPYGAGLLADHVGVVVPLGARQRVAGLRPRIGVAGLEVRLARGRDRRYRRRRPTEVGEPLAFEIELEGALVEQLGLHAGRIRGARVGRLVVGCTTRADQRELRGGAARGFGGDVVRFKLRGEADARGIASELRLLEEATRDLILRVGGCRPRCPERDARIGLAIPRRDADGAAVEAELVQTVRQARAAVRIVRVAHVVLEARRHQRRIGRRARVVTLLQLRAGTAHECGVREGDAVGGTVGLAHIVALGQPDRGRIEELRRGELRARRQRAGAEIAGHHEDGVAAERRGARQADVGGRVREREVKHGLGGGRRERNRRPDVAVQRAIEVGDGAKSKLVTRREGVRHVDFVGEVPAVHREPTQRGSKVLLRG